MTARRALRAALPVLLLLAACGGDGDDDDAEPAESTTTTTAPDEPGTTAGPTPSSAASPCPAVPPLPDSTAVDEPVDLDGDGAPDALRSASPGGALVVQVELAAGGGAVVELPVFGIDGPGVVGPADVDGDGTDELWVRTGAGASASILGLVDLAGCDFLQVTFADGRPAELPVGGTVGTAAGIACEAVALDGAADPATQVTAFLASRQADDSYEVTATEYALDGTTLRELRQSTAPVAASSPDLPRYGSFGCDDLSL